jgi:hypothetical protein
VGLSGADWGTLTDRQGLFRLPDVPSRAETYVFEMLGYAETTFVANAAVDGHLDIRLAPDPVILEGIEVIADRFESRRNATATSVRAFDREQLLASSALDVMNLLEQRFGLRRTPCPGGAGRGIARRGGLFSTPSQYDCAWVRGRPAPVTVCIDEMPILGGMDFLVGYQPHELYMVEVYGQGRQIRLYTNQFMERASRTRFRPVPLAASWC